MKVTLAKGKPVERVVDLNQVRLIPDLWHIAQEIKGQYRLNNPATGKPDIDAADAILEVWHFAHDLKDYVLEEEDEPFWFVWRLEGKDVLVSSEDFDKEEYELWCCFAEGGSPEVKIDLDWACTAGQV